MQPLYNTLLNTNQYQLLFNQWGWLVILALIWSLVWKGLALWYSARNYQRNWFVVLLVVNTVGILEIIYLLGFKKPRVS